jgi:ATP-dependent RNA helicase DDX1
MCYVCSAGPNVDSPEGWSEAVKRLKPRLLHRALQALRMPRCLVFCRTNQDCDNLEVFLRGLHGSEGGIYIDGNDGKNGGAKDPYSCAVLAGARSMEKRRAALRAFKEGQVRVLIATDVAARGVDVQVKFHSLRFFFLFFLKNDQWGTKQENEALFTR